VVAGADEGAVEDVRDPGVKDADADQAAGVEAAQALPARGRLVASLGLRLVPPGRGDGVVRVRSVRVERRTTSL
jgi:hypothetical protein